MSEERCTEFCRFLNVDETIGRIAAATEGAEFGFDLAGPWRDGASALRSTPLWCGEAGAAFRESDGVWALWFAPRPGNVEAFPSGFTLDCGEGLRPVGGAQNRRALSTWDCTARRFAGAQVCLGSPLVGGPPFAGAALVVLARPIGSA